MNDRRGGGEKTGRWQRLWPTRDLLGCEFCRFVCLYPDHWLYCPRCGARMEKDAEDEET